MGYACILRHTPSVEELVNGCCIYLFIIFIVLPLSENTMRRLSSSMYISHTAAVESFSLFCIFCWLLRDCFYQTIISVYYDSNNLFFFKYMYKYNPKNKFKKNQTIHNKDMEYVYWYKFVIVILSHTSSISYFKFNSWLQKIRKNATPHIIVNSI